MEFEGTDLLGLAPETIVRRGMTLVPEGRRVFSSLTVEENLMLGGAKHAARGNPAAQKKTPTGMETGGRLESFYGCGARDQNSL